MHQVYSKQCWQNVIDNHTVHMHYFFQTFYKIQGKDILDTAFINSCQHLQFIYSASNYLNPKDYYRYQ